MKRSLALYALVLVLGSPPWATGQDSGPDQFPLDVLPAADPAELQALAALPDAELTARLFAAAPIGRSPVLERFVPPGLSVFPVSHGFAGPRTSCLRDRIPAACRLHLEDLTVIQLRKQPRGLMNNPFGTSR